MEEKRLNENTFFTVIFRTGYWLHLQGGIDIQAFKQGVIFILSAFSVADEL